MPENVVNVERRSEIAHGEMLLRQHPWLRDILNRDEIPQAVSFKKPDLFHGISITFLGCFALLNPILWGSAYLPAAAVLLVLLGIGLIWLGVWLICFRKRSCVIVTGERVLYRRANLFGKYGKLTEISRADIKRVRYLKSTVMYRISRLDGAVSLLLKNGKTVVFSDLREGEKTFTSIR